MNVTKELDLAIKRAEGENASDGYAIGGKIYPTYMENAAWEVFKDAMPLSVASEFGAGGGGELSEKNGRPPKMASYGSSSRMLYCLSSRKEGFHFEKKLPTTLGGVAHLDGFYEDGYRYVFVEAKCHEPYAVKKNSVSKSYEELYRYSASPTYHSPCWVM